MGDSLIKSVVQATGLPEEPVHRELKELIEQHGISAEDITLDELRDVMVEYLQSVFLDLQKNNKTAS